MESMMIEMENLVKKFPHTNEAKKKDWKTAVAGISLSVRRGEVFGLLGPNGAGKTTIIRMLTMQTQPTSGHIRIGGQDIRTEARAVKERIGVVPQHVNFDQELTVWDNMELHARLHHMARAQRTARIEELLAEMALTEVRNDGVRRLSGGMTRRLLIVRALIHHPQVLFLDEPTVALDPQIRRHIWSIVREIARNGVTVLLKKTDYKKDEVQLNGSGGSGSSAYGPADYVNLGVFDNAIDVSGLANFTNTELSKALAGKNASAGLSMSEQRMHLSGSSTPKDIETMFQLAYLNFTKISKDQEAFNNMMEGLKVSLQNRATSPDQAFSDSLNATIYGHNPRVKPLELSDLSKVNYDRILRIAAERTANANGWRFIIIGNYDEAKIRPLIERYLGSLPSKGPNPNSKQVVFFKKGVIKNDFTRKMETPKANANMVWFSEDIPYTTENAIKASIAGQILSMVYIKKIREDASAAYSCGATGSASMEDKYHNVMLFAYCPMKPEKADVALKIMREEVVNLSKQCDASMLAKVKEYMAKEADDAMKSNGYWASVIGTWYRYGIDLHTNYKALVAKQTPESISNFVKEILKAGNHIQVTMMPAEEKK